MSSSVWLNRIDLRTSSQNPTVFKLSAYSLTVNSQYQITLTVQSLLSLRSAAANVLISIIPSNIVAQIIGSTTKAFKLGEYHNIDASSSYDQDYPNYSEQELLSYISFEWTCILIKPKYLPDCPLLLPLNYTSNTTFTKLLVSSEYHSLNTTSRISVRVDRKSVV